MPHTRAMMSSTAVLIATLAAVACRGVAGSLLCRAGQFRRAHFRIYPPPLVNSQQPDRYRGGQGQCLPRGQDTALMVGSQDKKFASADQNGHGGEEPPGENRRVLVIYTGGTIGMVRNERGVLAPRPNVLVQHLRQCAEMNDRTYAEKNFGPEGFLALPASHGLNRVLYEVVEYTPLLDSSDMSTTVWEQIADDIYAAYGKYDGFVILHGTDTMAYTSSALSFMLQDLCKPVVLTGSQLPLFDVRSDGPANFASAVIIAGCYPIPEVLVLFGGHLLRGNRAVKNSSSDLNAFESPNCPPIATVGVEIQVNHNLIRPCVPDRPMVVQKLSAEVGIFRIFPEMTSKIMRHFLRPPLRGIVLQTYGAGNIPATRKDLLDALNEAIESGLLILNCTQCSRGNVANMYAAGDVLEKIGVVCGADMTVEAALAKLAYVLQRDDWNAETKKRMLRASLRGELTPPPPPPALSYTDIANNKTGDVTMCTRLLATAAFADPALGPGLAAFAASGNLAKDDALKTLHELQHVAVDVIDGKDADGRTVLHAACRTGHSDVVKYLLKIGAKPFVKDRFGHTPLMDAILLDRHDIIQIIKEHKGATENGHGKTIETNGCSNKHLDRPSSPSEKKDDQYCLAGMATAAAASGNVTRLESLQMAGFCLDSRDPSGRTPLHVAVLHGLQKVVVFLLEVGVDKNANDLENRKPLDIARNLGRTSIIRLLE